MQETAQPFRDTGLTLMHNGLLLAAAEQFQQWLLVVEQTGDPRLILPALIALARVSQRRVDFEGALAWLDRATSLVADRRCQPHDLLRWHVIRLGILVRLGQLEQALVEATEAMALTGYMEDDELAVETYIAVANLHASRQEWPAVVQIARRAYDGALAVAHPSLAVSAHLFQGIAMLETGDAADARRHLHQTLSIGEKAGSRLASIHVQLGRAAQAECDWQSAIAHGSLALDYLFHEIGVLDKAELAEVSELLGGLLAEVSDRNLALKYLSRAAAYYSQLGRLAQWRRVTRRLAHALKANRPQGGSALRAEARRLDFLTAVLDLTDELEAVDPYLRGQAERVAHTAVLLGKAVGLSVEQLRSLQNAGRLHDVGMIAVDVEVLRKARGLTEAEHQRVRIHPLIGEQMVRPHCLPEDGLQAIRHHHEHWDGSGYPEGLSGERIPLLARIISVADVYDALTSNRVYRSSMSHLLALEQLRHMAGHELDPHLVNLFVQVHLAQGE